ncbi:MAG: aminoglycoside phosphotransferase family protein [Pseudomonadota bacterium]
MSDTIEAQCRALIAELGLGGGADVAEVTPLTGGVASDIARFRLGEEVLCAKFALAKLKVAEDWRAPVHRNAAEYAWLGFAAQVDPASAVRLYGRSEAQHGFVMAYIAGPDVYLWKTALLAEAPDRDEARRVGDALGRLHAASTKPGFDTAPFQNHADFWDIRIEPYLTFTATRHPDLAGDLHEMADALHAASQVLVHGDVSPKNILFRSEGPVFLDAECATMGDASFDPAFCLNHLVLKAVHLPASRARLLAAVGAFWAAYRAFIDFEDAAALEARVARLLPALMLARVDGKSPVEYLSETNRDRVRRCARALIADPAPTLAALTGRIEDLLSHHG